MELFYKLYRYLILIQPKFGKNIKNKIDCRYVKKINTCSVKSRLIMRRPGLYYKYRIISIHVLLLRKVLSLSRLWWSMPKISICYSHSYTYGRVSTATSSVAIHALHHLAGLFFDHFRVQLTFSDTMGYHLSHSQITYQYFKLSHRVLN